jgi:hypothetical protein
MRPGGEAFDLGYDEYLAFARKHVGRLVNDAVARVAADGMITPAEHDELVRQVLALDTVYGLDQALLGKLGTERR